LGGIEGGVREMSAVMDLFERSELEEAIDRLHDATAFYTAEPVVEQLLNMVNWPADGRRLVDSSCGDGAFLVAALSRLLTQRPEIGAEEIPKLMKGWEIHYLAADQARSRLAAQLRGHGFSEAQASEAAGRIVVHADFLKNGPDTQTWDVVAGNPPFCRYAHLPEVLRLEYERLLPDFAQGDMLHSFLDRCARTLKPGGELAVVTSDRWLFSMGAAHLREVIGKRLSISHLERLDCTSAFYRPKNRRAGQPPRIHPVAVVLRERGEDYTPLTREPIYPEADDRAYEGCRPLEAVANVRLAPWLGPHGIFVVDAHVARRLPAELLVPVVDTDNIKGGVLSASTKFAIRTAKDRQPCEAVMKHLDANLHLMPKSKQRKDRRWLPPESFERMALDVPSLLIPRIAASLRPVRLPPRVLPIDHGISIVTAGEASLEAIEEQLLSKEAQDWVKARAPRLENGYLDLRTTMLRKLPVRL
jgi:SAM-dependent methyltransferase